MSLFKKIMAVCLVVIFAVMLFGCGDENIGKADETVTTTASVSATDEVVTTIDDTLSGTESESIPEDKELASSAAGNGNTVEIMTMPETEIAEGESVMETVITEAESVTEVNSEPADEPEPETAIELPFIPAN